MPTPPLLLALALAATPAAGDPAAGTLRGRILFGGDPPVPAAVAVNKDEAVCGDRGLTDRSLVVGDAGGGEYGGIADVVVWLDVRASGRDLPDDGDDETLPPAVLDNVGCRFEPHVVLLRTGQRIEGRQFRPDRPPGDGPS